MLDGGEWTDLLARRRIARMVRHQGASLDQIRNCPDLSCPSDTCEARSEATISEVTQQLLRVRPRARTYDRGRALTQYFSAQIRGSGKLGVDASTRLRRDVLHDASVGDRIEFFLLEPLSVRQWL